MDFTRLRLMWGDMLGMGDLRLVDLRMVDLRMGMVMMGCVGVMRMGVRCVIVGRGVCVGTVWRRSGVGMRGV
jgi:hypothetical protein